MAVMQSVDRGVQLIIKPYRVAEDGDPKLISTVLNVTKGSAALVATNISVTPWDLRQLRQAVNAVTTGYCDHVKIANIDGDLLISLEYDREAEYVVVGIWNGEPHLFMTGYRFPVAAKELIEFGRTLEQEESRVISDATS